jgi:hypothetical protein
VQAWRLFLSHRQLLSESIDTDWNDLNIDEINLYINEKAIFIKTKF